uniref:Zinc finger FYVE domain-containing protein 9 n=1 Tax=Aceria tosichella TaxID=561515 RepID=A0A6G1S4M4_9ACAR
MGVDSHVSSSHINIKHQITVLSNIMEIARSSSSRTTATASVPNHDFRANDNSSPSLPPPPQASDESLSSPSQQHQQQETANHLASSDTPPSSTAIINGLPQQESTQELVPTAGESMSGTIRIPGTFPPEWLPDREAESCMACGGLFTLIRRRHHCRSCGKIFCGDCCKHKARLLYMDNKEARVCNNCHQLIEFTLSNPTEVSTSSLERRHRAAASVILQPSTSSSSEIRPDDAPSGSNGSSSSTRIVHGVLKTSSQAATNISGSSPNDCHESNSSSTDQHSNKQVIFSDGIRPGTDLSEPSPCQTSPSSSGTNSTSSSAFAILSRQNRKTATESQADCSSSSSSSVQGKKASKNGRSSSISIKNITVCDELGYLPPIIISKDAPIANNTSDFNTSNPLTNLIVSHFKSSKKTIQASMESRNCPLNGVVKFTEISDLVGVDNVITFLLLKGFHLKVKIIKKDCCLNRKKDSPSPISNCNQPEQGTCNDEIESEDKSDFADRSLSSEIEAAENNPEYWCFASSGLDKFGQDEIIFLLDKDKDNCCIPRDIFKIYLTLHELALRRQAIENLGNLLFQDGLFNCRDTAGLLFVQPSPDHCLKNLILPDKKFLIALVLQRWEVPWSKVFPMRLLLRLGHKYDSYPYPIVSFRKRDPVYYEIGHTIISILGDFRNFRYSLTHVDGLRVMMDKSSRKVTVHLQQSSYVQFSKVLDSSNNEHVLAWSSCPFPEADGHLVSVQNDEGHYNTVEFYKRSSDHHQTSVSFKNLETSEPVLGASFVVFSGALKVNQSGQPAKISIVEDGLLIQIQSCTMAALRNAIHYMDNFDIDCENGQDILNRVELRWQLNECS